MKIKFFSLSRAALVAALALATPALNTAAYADDEYGTGHETVVRQAAASRPGAQVSAEQAKVLAERYRLGGNDVFGAFRSSLAAPTVRAGESRLARP